MRWNVGGFRGSEVARCQPTHQAQRVTQRGERTQKNKERAFARVREVWSVASRGLGFDHFRLAYQLTIGRTLTMQLTVANDAATPLVFEEALHTYYAVADIGKIAIAGLDGVSYLDKVEDLQSKQQGDIVITGPIDRVYLDTTETCALKDRENKHRIAVAKTGSNTTVVWNPWQEGAAKLADMDPNEWQEFVAIETVNAAVDAITLAPGATHTMQAKVTVDELSAE